MKNRYGKILKFSFVFLTLFILTTLFFMLFSCDNSSTLDAPVISIDSLNVVTWDEVKDADKYIIFVNDNEYATQKSTYFAAFNEEGTYKIEVVAASDKENVHNSSKSNFVQYTVNREEKENQSFYTSITNDFDYFVRKKAINNDIYIYDSTSSIEEELVFVKSIQGLLAKEGKSLFVIENQEDLKILEVINEFNFNYINDFSEIVNIYINYMNGRSFISYASNKLDVAATLAGQKNLPIASINLSNKLKELGLVEEMKVDSQNINDIISEVTNKNLVISKVELIDLAILNSTIVSFTPDILTLSNDTLVFGSVSKKYIYYNKEIINNLSCLSILEKANINNEENPSYDDGLDMITLVNTSSVESTREFAENNVQPTVLTSIAPILKDYFGNKYDYSIGSLIGTLNSSTSNDMKNNFVMLNNIYLSRNNYKYVVLDNDSLHLKTKLSLMNNIQGAFIDNVSGKITWNNNKPFVEFVAILTEKNSYKLAAQVNELSLNDEVDHIAIKIDDSTSETAIKMFYSFLNGNSNVVSANYFMSSLKENATKEEQKVVLNDKVQCSVPAHYYTYDMYELLYSESNPSLYYLFTNDLSGFKSIGNVYSEKQSVYMQGNSSQNTLLYNKLLLPSWETIYLNFKVKSSESSSLKLSLFNVDSKEFITLIDERISNTSFKTMSINLSEYDIAGKEVVLLFEMPGGTSRDYLMVDDIKIMKYSEREEVFDMELVQLTTDKYVYELVENSFTAYGDVTFSNNKVLLESNVNSYSDNPQSYLGSYIKLKQSNASHPQLTIEFENSSNSLYRVRVVDENYINYLLCNWTTAPDKVTYDLSIFNNKKIYVFVEFNKKEGSDSCLTIKNIEINMIEGNYYYTTNEYDGFYGTSKEYNLCGWHINQYTTFGDLTGDSGYGSLRFDGTNNGLYSPDLVLGSAYKYYQLGNGSKHTLSFITRSGGPVDATYIRVKVIDENNKTHIVTVGNEDGWILISGEAWKTITCDLSKFAGQKVKVVLEQTDHGSGIGEIAFIDSIGIKEE